MTEPGLGKGLKFFDLVRLATRIFTVKPIRTMLTIVGTAIGISTVVFLVSLGYGLQYIVLGKLITTEDSLKTLEATHPSGALVERTELNQILALPSVKEISPVAEFSGEAVYGNATGLVLVRLVEPNYTRLSGISLDIGASHFDTGAIVLTSQAAQILNLPQDQSVLDKNVDLKFFNEEKNSEVSSTCAFRVTGLIKDDLEPPLIYAPVFAWTLKPTGFKSVLVKAEDVASLEKVRDELVEQGYVISARLDLVNQSQQIFNVITIVLGVFGVAALLVSAVGMFNTMIVSFIERTYEVGVMKSLGALDRDVRNLFLMESFLMGILGGVVGILMGMFGGEVVNFGINLLAKRLGGAPLDLFLTPTWFILLILFVSSGIGILAGFWPAHRATLLSPKEAFLRK